MKTQSWKRSASGGIDSLVKSIDDRFHMQMFTPRKPKSAWS
jgi:hypothetical protein